MTGDQQSTTPKATSKAGPCDSRLRIQAEETKQSDQRIEEIDTETEESPAEPSKLKRGLSRVNRCPGSDAGCTIQAATVSGVGGGIRRLPDANGEHARFWSRSPKIVAGWRRYTRQRAGGILPRPPIRLPFQ